MGKLVSLCKRRGLVFPGSEIYGGLGSTWDYGPLGVELKRNVKEAWWRATVHRRDDVVGLDAAILMHPRTWEASGHAEGFADPLMECTSCNQRFRTDDPRLAAPIKFGPQATLYEMPRRTCPDCGGVGTLTDPRMFNLMFKTFVGPVEDSASQAWLRPETAQGIFVNFASVLAATRLKLPFGIAQIGKSFRNEITPGNFIFRTREFEQMELEYFVKPGTDDQWLDYWLKERLNWYLGLGLRQENLRLREHGKDELAHYAKACSDVEYRFPWGWAELEGIANRTDFDLKRHSDFSGQDLSYFDQETGERYTPYVIEPSGGVDRTVLALLVDAYDEEPDPTGKEKEVRTVLRFHPDIAPVKVAVLPLSRNEKLVPTARQVYATVRQRFMAQYDDAQSIGRRYRRQDEVGTPLCVTVDFQTVEQDNQVTIRHRDTMAQVRVPIPELVPALEEQLAAMGQTSGPTA
ncbi:MAG: glycine--tRNA ligase [Chloroflexi bacterium]|nr:glycine--tRNA ligase [Chloroflexota bacterium]